MIKNQFAYSLYLRSLSVPFASLAASLCFCIAAQAAEFEQGCQFYKEKNYVQARGQFEKAVKTFPNNWLVHYYLANTYLMTKQSASAVKEYQNCLNCKPNAATSKYCQDAVLKLTGVAATVAEPASNTPGEGADSTDKATKTEAKVESKPDVKEAASQAIIAADQARAEEILKRAQEECKAIREEARLKIENGKFTGNKWYRLPDGTRYIDLMPHEKDEISKEAEDRCEEIMRIAENRASRLQH